MTSSRPCARPWAARPRRTLALWAEVERLVADGHRHLVVDLARVTLLDTAIVSLLVRTSSALRDAGGTLRLANVGPSARHVLAIVGLTTWRRRPPSRRSPLAPWACSGTVDAGVVRATGTGRAWATRSVTAGLRSAPATAS